MRCPFCSSPETQVKDSRPTDENTAIRRRRYCTGCGGRFTTFERIQLRELHVRKKDGSITIFDRDKMARSVYVALRKRDVDEQRVEQMITGIVRQLESLGEPEISSEAIGLQIMDALRQIDDVAYVRFASVYKDFSQAGDFAKIIGEMDADSEG